MIPAGTLLYSLIFKENQTVQSESGAVTKHLIELLKCRAAKVKQSGNYSLDSKELFHSNTIAFKIRYNKLLSELLIVEYEKNDYKITSFDRNLFDNSIDIILEKINK